MLSVVDTVVSTLFHDLIFLSRVRCLPRIALTVLHTDDSFRRVASFPGIATLRDSHVLYITSGTWKSTKITGGMFLRAHITRHITRHTLKVKLSWATVGYHVGIPALTRLRTGLSTWRGFPP